MKEMTNTSVAEELQTQISRVRDEVLPMYREVANLPGVNCAFAITVMTHLLDESVKALAEGDAVLCIKCLAELRKTE